MTYLFATVRMIVEDRIQCLRHGHDWRYAVTTKGRHLIIRISLTCNRCGKNVTWRKKTADD